MVVFRQQGQSLRPGRTLREQDVNGHTTLKATLVDEDEVAAWKGGNTNKVLFLLHGFDAEEVALEAELSNTVADLIQVLRARGDVWGRGLQVSFKDMPLALGSTLEKAGVLVAPTPDEDATLHVSAGQEAGSGTPAATENKKCCTIM